MTRITPSLAFSAALVALALNAAPSHAQQARSFVSGLGSDSNAPNCVRTAPCRTFQVAHDNTLANGEISVLDGGSYGSVTITKNISIINDGVGEAGALVSGGATGITINAGATDAVTLRGLTIKGIGFGGGNGILFHTGRSLALENCVIRNMTGTSPLGIGVVFEAATTTSYAVTNTTVTDNQNWGIIVAPLGGSGIVVSAVLNGVSLYNNQFGFAINGSNASNTSLVTATITNSVAGNNMSGFVAASSSGQASTSILLTNSVAAGNGVGLDAEGGFPARILVGGSTLTSNNTNLVILNGAGVFTWGNNYQAFNLTTNAFTPPAVPLQ